MKALAGALFQADLNESRIASWKTCGCATRARWLWRCTLPLPTKNTVGVGRPMHGM